MLLRELPRDSVRDTFFLYVRDLLFEIFDSLAVMPRRVNVRFDSVAWFARKFILRISILCLFLFVQSLAAQEKNPRTVLELPQLSSDAVISLVTYTPGTELYTAFGHSCIRIRDDILGFDRLYNFGTFDFDTPNFYLKFARGDLLYELAVGPSKDEILERADDGMGITELVLRLSPAQKQDLFQDLEINLLPENRAYLYDFILDNCSTRVRDVFERVLGEKLSAPLVRPITFRQMLDPYLQRLPWTQFGLYLLLGSPVDREVTGREACFLPADLERAVEAAQIGHEPFTFGKTVLFRAAKLPEPAKVQRPEFVFALLGLGWLLIWALLRRGHSSRLTGVVLIALGAGGGLILAFLMFSRHWVTRDNLNLIWLWPTHLLAGLWLILWPNGGTTFLRWYCLLALVLTALFLAASSFLPQSFPRAIYPLGAIVVWRCFLEVRARWPDRRSL